MDIKLLKQFTKHRAFTLVELLVVISIIAVLLGILMPALNKARQAGKAITCGSKMRQIGFGVLMYAQDNRDTLPRSSHSAATYNTLKWAPAIMPYVSSSTYKGDSDIAWKTIFNSLYRCTCDKRRNKTYSYGKNVWFELDASNSGGKLSGPLYCKLTQIRRQSAVVEFGEITETNMADHVMAHAWLMGGKPEIDTTRHGKASNFTFLDGHVQTMAFAKTFDLRKQIDNWNPATAQ